MVLDELDGVMMILTPLSTILTPIKEEEAEALFVYVCVCSEAAAAQMQSLLQMRRRRSRAMVYIYNSGMVVAVGGEEEDYFFL